MSETRELEQDAFLSCSCLTGASVIDASLSCFCLIFALVNVPLPKVRFEPRACLSLVPASYSQVPHQGEGLQEGCF